MALLMGQDYSASMEVAGRLVAARNNGKSAAILSDCAGGYVW